MAQVLHSWRRTLPFRGSLPALSLGLQGQEEGGRTTQEEIELLTRGLWVDQRGRQEAEK